MGPTRRAEPKGPGGLARGAQDAGSPVVRVQRPPRPRPAGAAEGERPGEAPRRVGSEEEPRAPQPTVAAERSTRRAPHRARAQRARPGARDERPAAPGVARARDECRPGRARRAQPGARGERRSASSPGGGWGQATCAAPRAWTRGLRSLTSRQAIAVPIVLGQQAWR